MRIIAFILVFLNCCEFCFARERVFILVKQTCYVAGGQVFASSNNEDYYSEVLGSLASSSMQVCGKSFFDTRACSQMTFYSFRTSCRDGIASAPQLFMALFGREEKTRQNGFALANSNQLSYVDPVRDFSGAGAGRRIYLPPGYAPLVPIETHVRRLDWDDVNERPTFSRSLTSEQERRIKQLFVVRNGVIEPFPQNHIQRAVGISNEQPPPPPIVRPSPAITPSSPPSSSQVGNTAFTESRVTAFLIAGAVWLVGIVLTRRVPPESVMGRILVGTLVALGSSCVLLLLGFKDELTVFSVTILGGIVVIGVSILF